MSDEPILIPPIVHQTAEQPQPALADHASRLATPEEIDAADRLFAQQEKEANLVSGLLGMYTGTLVLRDLMAEHLQHEDEAPNLERPRPKKE